MCVRVCTRSCLTLCDPSRLHVHGISQGRILEWAALSCSSESSDPRIAATSPALAGRFFSTAPPGKPKTTIPKRRKKKLSSALDSFWSPRGESVSLPFLAAACSHSLVHGLQIQSSKFHIIPRFPFLLPSSSTYKGPCNYTGPTPIIQDNLPILKLADEQP